MEAYRQIRVIGVGSFGRAILCRCIATDAYRVIKQIPLQQSESNSSNRVVLNHDKLLNEVKLLIQCSATRHPNILTYFDSFIHTSSASSSNNASSNSHHHQQQQSLQQYLCIVTSYCNDSDLRSFLSKWKRSSRGDLNEQFLLDIFVQICLGLMHIHSQQVIHRDLKLSNIFLQRSSSAATSSTKHHASSPRSTSSSRYNPQSSNYKVPLVKIGDLGLDNL
jgi:NIMA (never in mitosis gene a)-related kinase 1/4/5